MKRIMVSVALSSWVWVMPAYAFDLVVRAGSANQPVSNNHSYSITKGTKSITLLYNVFSAEYPQYVTAQSIYNDVWSLSLTGSAGTLFEITRQVNSQLTQAPTWLPNSTTGDIKQTVDISGLTQNGDTTLQLLASAMNVGDGALPTIVSAGIQSAEKLTIDDATPDTITANNDGTFYSVPSPGETNTLQRYFTLTVNKSETVTLTNVSVTLQGPGDLMNVVNQLPVPSGTDVSIVNQTATSAQLKVRVTVRDPASSVNGSPPPTKLLAYKFRVEGTDSQSGNTSGEKTVTGRHALWRSAAVLTRGRYGSRTNQSPGGDDWAARGTYNWLLNNISLINEVDDISGEHGRNIGHTEHQYGTDIDTYHFYRFPGAISGTDNYNKLLNTVITAFGTLNPDGTKKTNPSVASSEALSAVQAFVSATRNGIDHLEALNTVSRMFYMIGSAGSGLPNGWAKSLLTTGKVSRTETINSAQVTRTIDFGLGNWSGSNGKLCSNCFNVVHNNHIHVRLDRTAIGE